MRFLAVMSMMLCAGSATAAQVDDAAAIKLAQPQELVAPLDPSQGQRSALIEPVDAFYGFWNNGSARLFAASVAPDFVDHTLPPGRPQGPAGPAMAARTFLAAVPDLQVAVVMRLIAADRVVSHLRFTGHFTGRYKAAEGTGQPIDFIATDILRVRGGKVTDNWHLEDNLTFLRQIGLAPRN